MEASNSKLNVILWSCMEDIVEKDGRFTCTLDTQSFLSLVEEDTVGWRFKWRCIHIVGNEHALHFLSEDTYRISNVSIMTMPDLEAIISNSFQGFGTNLEPEQNILATSISSRQLRLREFWTYISRFKFRKRFDHKHKAIQA